MAPYKYELASAIGHFDLLSESNKAWIEDRLKTYSRRESETHWSELFASLLVTDPEALTACEDFTKAVAIDGSLSTIESPNVTAIKVASVWRDLTKKPQYINGVLDPNSLIAAAKDEASIGLLPGAGIYPASGEGSWDTKFREEFFQNLRHIPTHGTNRHFSLMAYLRELLNDYSLENKLICPNCSKDTIDFEDSSFESFCSLCNVPVYFSDYLTKALFASKEKSTQPMLLIERLMLHALIAESAAGRTPDFPLEETLFIADGSLQVFGLPEFAKTLLKATQSQRKAALVSFMKSGRVQELLSLPGIDDVIKPGTLAMVTSDAWKMLFKTRGEAGIYGKAFAYRTKSGEKWFSFMVPPMFGDPVANAPILNDWANYPKLRAICRFIESNQSNENGPTGATLELIGRANKAASLPKELSRKALAGLVHSVI